MHIFELGAVFQRRGDEDGAHRVCRVSGHAASAQQGVERSRPTQRNEVVSGVADSEAEIVFSSASAVLRLMLDGADAKTRQVEKLPIEAPTTFGSV
jgi:hypothetical protein